MLAIWISLNEKHVASLLPLHDSQFTALYHAHASIVFLGTLVTNETVSVISLLSGLRDRPFERFLSTHPICRAYYIAIYYSTQTEKHPTWHNSSCGYHLPRSNHTDCCRFLPIAKFKPQGNGLWLDRFQHHPEMVNDHVGPF